MLKLSDIGQQAALHHGIDLICIFSLLLFFASPKKSLGQLASIFSCMRSVPFNEQPHGLAQLLFKVLRHVPEIFVGWLSVSLLSGVKRSRSRPLCSIDEGDLGVP